jgi:hypothetical protein
MLNQRRFCAGYSMEAYRAVAVAHGHHRPSTADDAAGGGGGGGSYGFVFDFERAFRTSDDE